MITANNVRYFDKVLAYLLQAPKGTTNIHQLTVVCDGDFDLAKAIVNILRRREFVQVFETSMYHSIDIIKDGLAATFYKNGGFIAEFEEENELKLLQKENLKLQNENLEYAKTIRAQEQQIRDLDQNLKTVEMYKTYWWAFTGGGAIAGYLLSLFI